MKWNRQNRRQKQIIHKRTSHKPHRPIILHRKRNFVFSGFPSFFHNEFRNNWTLCECARVSIMRSIHFAASTRELKKKNKIRFIYFWFDFFFFVRHQLATFSQQCPLSVRCTRMHTDRSEHQQNHIEKNRTNSLFWAKQRTACKNVGPFFCATFKLIRCYKLERPQRKIVAIDRKSIILSINAKCDRIIDFCTAAGLGDWLRPHTFIRGLCAVVRLTAVGSVCSDKFQFQWPTCQCITNQH